jgi:hypothetical protein
VNRGSHSTLPFPSTLPTPPAAEYVNPLVPMGTPLGYYYPSLIPLIPLSLKVFPLFSLLPLNKKIPF